MGDERYPNSGILFKQGNKTSERAPDYKGDCEITCTKCNTSLKMLIAGWLRDGRNNTKFLSLKFESTDGKSKSEVKRRTAQQQSDQDF